MFASSQPAGPRTSSTCCSTHLLVTKRPGHSPAHEQAAAAEGGDAVAAAHKDFATHFLWGDDGAAGYFAARGWPDKRCRRCSGKGFQTCALWLPLICCQTSPCYSRVQGVGTVKVGACLWLKRHPTQGVRTEHVGGWVCMWVWWKERDGRRWTGTEELSWQQVDMHALDATEPLSPI